MRFLIRIALLLCSCCPPSIALGAPAEGPACPRPFSLALHDHGLLYSERSGSGIDKDVADELARRSGCQFIVSVLPRARIWKMLEAGVLDFSLSGITSPEREGFAYFAWYFADKYSLLVRRDAEVARHQDFLAAPRLMLGTIRSFRYSPIADRLVDSLSLSNRVLQSASYDALYRNLAIGRIDGIIVEPFDDPELDRYGIRDQVIIVDIDDVRIPHGVIMSKKSLPPAEAQKWRQLVEAMRSDGTMLRIFEKYFPRETARELVNF